MIKCFKLILTVFFVTIGIFSASLVFAATEFVSVIDPGNGAGTDYLSLSSWESAVETNLTANTTKVFSGTRTGALSDNSTVYLCRGGIYQAVTANNRHAVASQILVQAISDGGFVFQLGDVWYANDTCNSAAYFSVSDVGDSAIAVAKCRTTNGTADASQLWIEGWTTSATNYIKVWTDSSEAYRHGGAWDDSKYRLERSSEFGQLVYITEEYVRIDGLQLNNTGSKANQSRGIRTSATNTASDIRISNNIIKATGSGVPSGLSNGLLFGGLNTKVWNNVIYGWYNGIGADYGNSIIDRIIYNNTVYNNSNSGIFVSAGANENVRVFDNLSYLSGVTDYDLTGVDATGANISEDSTSPNSGATDCGGHSCRNQTVSFVDATNDDFHLLPSDTSAKNAGVDLSADANLPFDTDIDGQTRFVPWDIGADQSPKNVFYSVGQSTADLKTGTPTVTITSGAAVFSVAQTGNIGVGDRVTYNTNQIAYISAKTHSDGMHWSLITATGSIPADITTSTVVSIKHEYTTLNSAIAGASDANHLNTTDLNAANVVLNIPCYYDSAADTTAVTVSGYTTGANNFIKIYTPVSTSTEANNSQRHQGKWDDGKYNLKIARATEGSVEVRNANVWIDGLQVETQGLGAYHSPAIRRYNYDVNGFFQVSKNILRANVNQTVSADNLAGVVVQSVAGQTVRIWDNIIYNFKRNSGNGNGIEVSYPNSYVYNNTIYDSDRGLYSGSNNTMTAKNNLVVNCTTAATGSTFAAGTDYNATNNPVMNYVVSGGGNTHDRTSQAISFVDAINKDFHLSPFDTSAKNAGADLSADANLPVTTDIDGQTRPTGAGAVDIGADEAATAIYYSVGQNTNDHKTGSPTVDISNGTATFSVAQTATNMGVGDKVTYNTSSVAYISEKISTAQWKLITATGATPANVTGQTVNSIAHTFNSLSAAVTGASGAAYLNTSDLKTNNYQLNFPAYYDSGADTTKVTVSGYVTGLSNFIRIYTPTNISTEVNQSQRHQGGWDNTKYSLITTAAGNYQDSLRTTVNYTKIDGLQIKNNASGFGCYNIATNGLTANDNRIEISNNILTSDLSGNTGASAIDNYDVGKPVVYVSNNIIYDISGVGVAVAGNFYYISNNTIYNASKGVTDLSRKSVLKNNAVFNSSSGSDYVNNFSSGINNVSSDTTANSYFLTNGLINKIATNEFVDVANRDFHLKPTSSLKNAGADLSADTNFAFNTDIDGQIRPSSSNTTWDIGADEAATAIYYSVGQNTTSHETGSGTVTVDSINRTATFSVAQTATNMGVGDLVTYTGGSCYITSKTSTTVWGCQGATGGNPAAATNADVTSIAHAFASLSAAVTGATGASYLNTSDLTAGNYQLNFPCYYDSGADTTAVTISGYVTSANNNIRIYTPSNTSTEVNNSQRHLGKWDDGKYKLSFTGAHINVLSRYVNIDGLQVKNSGSGWGSSNCIFSRSGTRLTVENSILVTEYVYEGSSHSAGINIEYDSAPYFPDNVGYLIARNNIIYSTTSNAETAGIKDRSTGTTLVTLDNNTIVNCNFGIIRAISHGGTISKNLYRNNIIQGAAFDTTTSVSGMYGAGFGFVTGAEAQLDPTSDNNISNDATAPNATFGGGQATVMFADSFSKDYHLSFLDIYAKNKGKDLSAIFTSDIDNQTRDTNFDIGADEAASNVFYSVGQSTADLKTGIPTVTITAGVAVFSVAQTGNIGVGDRVTYNTDQIAYISAKTHSDGMHWSLVTATGSIPADITTSTVVSIKHEYTTLNSAIAGASDANHINNTDLTAANVVLNIPCYYDSGADTTNVNVTGYTTSANNYIKIYTPNNTSTESNNSQRHQGKWDDGRYCLTTSGAYDSIMNSVSYTIVDGLQVSMSQGGNYGHSVIKNVSRVSNSIVKSIGDYVAFGIEYRNGGPSQGEFGYIYNNLVYDIYSNSSTYGFGIKADYETVYIYNNTILNSYEGIHASGHTGTSVIAKNNLVHSSITSAFVGTFAAGTDYNLTDSSSMGYTVTGGGNTHDKTGQNIVFADAANKDFHLSPSDTAAKNSGVDLSADANLPVTTDIDGQTRPTGVGTVDIGADEAATAIYYSVGQNISDHKTGSPTITISSGTATFSVAQTATNMGVGDKVTYNTSSVAYISEKISTTQWKLITATGATPADVTGQTVNSIAHAFASLSAAEAGAPALLGTSDLVAGNYQLNFPCYYDSGADTTPVTIDGYTTGLSNYIKIYTPNNTTTEVNQSQRHQGKWDDMRFKMEFTTTSSWQRKIFIQDNNVKIDGIQVKLTYAHSDSYAIETDPASEISNSIIQGVATGADIKAHGIAGGGLGVKIYNNIVYGFRDTNSSNGYCYYLGNQWNILGVYVYNNVAYDCYRGYTDFAGSSVRLMNNIAQNSIDGFYATGSFHSSSDYNISDLADDAPGANSKNSTNVAFADEANFDFHLSSADTAAKKAGINLQNDPYFRFSNDIDGQERAGNWDIGADEFAEVILQSQQSSSNLDNGLVGHWTFDGNDIDGTSAKDISGNNNHGTISGATKAIGKLGQALSFNGTSDYVDVMDDNSLDLNDNLTLSAWLKAPLPDNTNAIVSKGALGAGSTNYGLSVEYGVIWFYTYGTTNNNWNTGVNASTYCKDGCLIVVTYDGTNKKVFINGDERASVAATGIPVVGNNSVKIGWDGNLYHYTGVIDDVRIYNRALSENEIGQLYHLGIDTIVSPDSSKGNTDGLVGYWSFDGGTINGTTVNDLSGNGNNGTISGATKALGKLGQGMNFDGGISNSYVSIADPGVDSVLDFGNGDSMSVSAWINPSSFNSANDGIALISKNTTGSCGYDTNYNFLHRNGCTNNCGLKFHYRDTGGINNIYHTDDNVLSLNKWQFVTMVYTFGVGSSMNIYVDGQLKSGYWYTGEGNGIPLESNQPVWIGADNYCGGQSVDEEFNGKIDEVRFYNRALSLNEISELYNVGKVEIRK